LIFNDKELITLVAKVSGYSKDSFTQNEQRMPKSMLYQMILLDYEALLDKNLSNDFALYVVQSKVFVA